MHTAKTGLLHQQHMLIFYSTCYAFYEKEEGWIKRTVREKCRQAFALLSSWKSSLHSLFLSFSLFSSLPVSMRILWWISSCLMFKNQNIKKSIFYPGVSGLSLHVCIMCVSSHRAALQLAVLLAQVWHLRPEEPQWELPLVAVPPNTALREPALIIIWQRNRCDISFWSLH